MVSHLNSFWYVEMDGEFIETPCQNFEEVPQTLAFTEVVVEEPPMKMASLKDARVVIEKGGCANWGQLPDFAHKTDKFGLGFYCRSSKGCSACADWKTSPAYHKSRSECN